MIHVFFNQKFVSFRLLLYYCSNRIWKNTHSTISEFGDSPFAMVTGVMSYVCGQCAVDRCMPQSWRKFSLLRPNQSQSRGNRPHILPMLVTSLLTKSYLLMTSDKMTSTGCQRLGLLYVVFSKFQSSEPYSPPVGREI